MREKNKGKLRLKRLSAALLLAGAVLYENTTLQTSTYDFPVWNLPKEFEDYRIVQISDLHAREYGTEHCGLLEAVRRQQPDVILLTGDIAEVDKDTSKLAPLFSGLSDIAPTYFTTGNHEWSMAGAEREKLFSLLVQNHIEWLHSSYTVITRGTDKIVLAGVDDPNGPKTQKTPRQLVQQIREKEGEDVCIFVLYHRNTDLPMWSHLGVSGVFSGHVHGGIIRVPFVGGVFGTELDLFPQYDAGVFTMNKTTMLISRGLSGNRKMPLRIFNRPEIPTAVLKRQKED